MKPFHLVEVLCLFSTYGRGEGVWKLSFGKDIITFASDVTKNNFHEAVLMWGMIIPEVRIVA